MLHISLRVCRLAFAGSLLFVLLVPAAQAHNKPGIHDLVRDVRIELGPGRVHLILSQVVGQRIAMRWRKQIDRDQSGTISAQEEQAFLRRQGQRASASLALYAGAQLLPLRPTRHAMGLSSRDVRAGRFGFDLLLEARLPTRAGQHHLRLLDRARSPHRGHTTIHFVPTGGALLVSGRLWNQRPRPQFRFVFADPALAQTRRELHITATFPTPTRPRHRSASATAKPRRSYQIWMLAALFLCAGLLLWQRQRLKYKSESPPKESDDAV